ncbi:MAG: RNA 2',3'-cyclic phosphodiesterase [Magnetococcales bacterium]|nr:RNA 2',3'-cyclic phosphodiesterase [Magnetococcales bacterium]
MDFADQERLFIASSPSDALRAELVSVVQQARSSLTGLRWLNATNYHLTLRFLGEITTQQQTILEEGLTRLAARTQPMTLDWTRWGVFPAPANPRVVWLGLGGETLPALTDLVKEIRSIGWEDPIEQRFQAHVTVARSRQPKKLSRYQLERLPLPKHPWLIDKITLFSSKLSQSGTVYQPVFTKPLIEPVR